MNKSTEIRNQFLGFFREKGHTIVPSAPVIPTDDQTLLFTNAGMNQFKDVFLEQGSRSYTRAVDSQKCIRVSGKHNDLEEVGPSPNHHTFFEMLGNWSFGDYYKREAIQWAWELVTGVWQIDPARLYATVYEGDDDIPPDDEARNAWLELTEIGETKISYHGRKDNFWEMGDVGPCGPCSELHYDMGPEFCNRKDEKSHICEVNGDCGRIIELWNLVFIQYFKDDAWKLHPLPHRHVDTGAGLERFLRVLEGVGSNYETELFKPMLAELIRLSGVDYSRGDSGIPHRVAVDHVRSLAFSLADGGLPSNEGRGYVIRRILRRAARYGREIGLETPFLYKLVDPLVEVMGDAYPELKDRHSHIVGVIKAEEESFARTLGRGLELFGGILEKVKKQKSSEIPGDDAFKLYDTYGFPLDLTQLMAREQNLKVDNDRFDELMEQQRIRAKSFGEFEIDEWMDYHGRKFVSQFVGYDHLEIETIIEGVDVHQKKDADNKVYYLKAAFILRESPFYVESGGQVSDQGTIESAGHVFEVEDLKKNGDCLFHIVQWKEEYELTKFPRGTSAIAKVDQSRRIPTQYNHTATHLLHKALRRHLGQHVNQAGSLVAPDRMRFDFTHFEKPSSEILKQVELTVNRAIRADYPVRWYVMPYKEAVESGITALFGEKYGDEVRVIHIGSDEEPYSRELCGGTHVARTGQLGLFRIVSESAVSAGVRRIEAVTGEVAIDMSMSERQKLEQITDLLGSHGSDPVEKLAKTLDERHNLEKEFERLLEKWADSTATDLISSAEILDGVKVTPHLFDGLEMDRMKMIGDRIRARDSHTVALLTSSVASGAGQLCCVVGDALLKHGKLKAGELVGKAAKLAGGGGGGRPHMATAGTKYPDRLLSAVKGFTAIVKEALGGN